MSLKGKAAAIGIGELKPFKEPCDLTALGQMARVAAEVLGLNLRMLNQVDIGGASRAGMIWRAAAAIDAGMCSAVLCLVADLNKVGDQRPPVVSVQREFEAP